MLSVLTALLRPARSRAPAWTAGRVTWRSSFCLLIFFCTRAAAAHVIVQVDANTYKTEHCLFIVDSTVTWASPATAYNDLYALPFTRLNSYFTTLTTLFPASYFSVCYIANTGDSHVPNYIDQIYKAAGISTGMGSAGIGNGNPNAPQSFSTVDLCRYNLNSAPFGGVLAVFDHELGHAWGAQFFNNVSGVGPGILSNGHWLSNTTIDCQMSNVYSGDGGLTINKLYGDPANGFRYQRVDNLRSNDTETLSEQALYLMGVADKFPTTYALNGLVYNSDLTVSSSSVETYDQAAVIARYGARNPDYRTSPKRFKVAFVYIARDAAEVNSVYTAVEQAADQFGNAEALDPAHYRFQTPFLVDTQFRASADTRLADLDGNTTPVLTVTDTYVASIDGAATVNFVATDAAGPAPSVLLVPASTQAAVVGSTVQLSGLPDGVHFFTLKAVNAAGKRTFAHFVVEVQRPVTATAIATQPVTRTATAGASVTYAVTPSGSAPFTYQWFRATVRTSTWNKLADGGPYGGASSASLTVATTTDMSGDKFLCMVTNAVGEATSTPAALVVNETAPVISSSPADTLVPAGSVAHFSVTAAGAPLTFGYSTYQWQKQASGSGAWINLVDAAGAFVGSTTSSLIVYGTVVGMTGDQYRCVVTNTVGSTNSAAAVLTVAQAPAVTTQPTNVSASAGQTVSFTIVATGTAPLSYQWLKYSTPIPGATGTTLTLTNVQSSDSASYGCKVTNSAGTAYSNYASLSVAATAPSITTHPQSQTVAAGAGVNFTVAATGSTPLTYQWAKNGTAISGATFSNYAILSAQASDAGNYVVTVTNSAGSAISATAVLAVTASPPSVTTPPQSISVLSGSSATFSVSVSGTSPFTYQWLKNSVAITGATNATLTVANVQASDVASYSVSVTNSAGSVTSAAAALTLTVVVTPPTISAQPQGLTVNAGTALGFSVAATGTAPFAYQWFHDGAAIAGATSSTFAIAAAQAADAGNYTATVSNSAGTATSNPAPLVVNALPIAPTIAAQPAPATVAPGAGVTYYVTPSGTPPFTYQWYKNGAVIAGANAASYSIAVVSAADAGVYSVTITNAAGSVTSVAATLTVTSGSPGTPPPNAPTTLVSNLSVRTTLESGQTLIPGFVTNGKKALLLRAAGPALTALGVGLNGLPDPLLQVYDGSSMLVASNDDWNSSLAPMFSQLGAFAFANGSKDAALVTSLNGPSSAFVTGAGSGSVLLELYDTQTDYANRLVNVSARNRVGTGADALIVGFVITGSGTKQLLIRGIGPALAHFGVAGPLADPYLELFDANAQKLMENDNWDSALAPTFTRLGAFALNAGSKDAALLVTLPPGIYSAKLTGMANTTGEGLIEIYEIWP